MSPTMDPLGASRPQAATTSAATGTPQQSCCWIGTLFLPWTVSSTTAEDPAGPSSQTHGFPTSNSSSPNVSFGVTSPAKFPSLKRKLTLSKMTMLPPPAPPKSTTTPLTVSQQEDSVSFSPCYFGNIGLQNAVQSFSKKELNRKWVGILGGISTQDWSDSLRTTVEKSLLVHDQIPVFLQDNELDGHYNKFCKQILWKTFHYQFPADTGTTFDQNAWTQYVNVNQKFALKLAGLYKPGDVIWINDYHLMLVPAMLRKLLPDATIGFFLHIPFPSSEIFRCLYVRKEILHGMLGADLIGFQTYSFQRHFLMTCSRLLSLESTPKGIQLENTIVSVGIFPIGIDIRALNEKRNNPEVPDMIAALKEKYAGKKVVIGRDKNDYVKGVRLKLLSFERFLYLYPEWVGKVVLIQVALSTTEANENECMVSDVVARINSKFGTIEYLPVVYLHQDISFSHYLALLTIADACLITSLRDGMNLTSHEYVICQEEQQSPLIMSEFAGTYGSLGCAIRVNPWDKQEVAEAIYDALTMNEEEKLTRWKELYRNVRVNSAQNFVEGFIKETKRVHEELSRNQSSQIPLLNVTSFLKEFSLSSRRLLLLDDEGTLWKSSGPTSLIENKSADHLYGLLFTLASDSRNIVYLMSGRRRDALEYYKDIPHLGISAENGSFLKFTDRLHWIPMLPDIDVSWKKAVNEIFEYYTDRTPGSYIEQKETSVVWHFGLADQNFGAWQALECSNHIQNALGATYSIHPVSKKKSVEVMPRNVNKGVAVRRILEHHQGRKMSGGGSALSATNTYASPTSNSTYRRDNPTPPSVPLTEDAMSPDIYYASPKVRSVSPTHGHRKGWIDFIFCVGDDRQDEYMFEHMARYDARTRSHSSGNESVSPLLSEAVTPVHQELDGNAVLDAAKVLLKQRTIWTCTVGIKSSAAKWYLPSISDTFDLLNKMTELA